MQSLLKCKEHRLTCKFNMEFIFWPEYLHILWTFWGKILDGPGSQYSMLILKVRRFQNISHSKGRQFFFLGNYTPASNLGYLAPPQDNFSWVPNCSLGPPGWETKVSSKKIWFGLCEIAWSLCKPISNLRRGGLPIKLLISQLLLILDY